MEPAKTPIVNVWSVRKEQLAARATSSTSAPSVSPSSATMLSSIAAKNTLVTPSNTKNNVQKPGTSNKAPSMMDAESWPDVTASLSRDVNGKDKEKVVKGAESQPRKEKTKKWVPIPAEELQAAVDAHKAASSSSRKRGGGDDTRDRSSTRKNANRGTLSQAASTSQSRVQSRSGSVQSSPRNAGRRRLPERDSPRTNGASAGDDPRAFLKPGSSHRPTSSARSSKSGSPYGPLPTRLPQHTPPPATFLPGHFVNPNLPPMPHPSLPPPPHLAYGPHHLQSPFQSYPGYPPPPVPFGLSPVLTPSAVEAIEGGLDGPGYPFYPTTSPHVAPHALYSTSRAQPSQRVNGDGATADGGNSQRAPVQFGSIPMPIAIPANGSASTVDNDADHSPAVVLEATAPNDAAGRQLVVGVAPEDLSAVVRGVKHMAISGNAASGPVRNGKRSRRSSFAVPTDDQDSSGAITAEAKAKWEFGTASGDPTSTDTEVVAQAARLLDVVAEDGTPSVVKLSPLSMSLSASPGTSQVPLATAGADAPPGLGLPQPQHPPSLTSKRKSAVSDSTGNGANTPPLTGPLPGLSTPGADEDFEVKDYGFGFGQGGARKSDAVREMIAREKEVKERQRALAAAAQSVVQPVSPQSPSQQHHMLGGRDGRRGSDAPRMPRPFDGDRDRVDARGPRRGGQRGGGSSGGGPHNRNRRSNIPQGGASPSLGALPPPFVPHSHPHAPPLHIPPFMSAPFMHGSPLPPGMMPPGLEGMPSPTFYGGMRPGYMGPPPTGAVSYLPPLPPAPPLPPQLQHLGRTSPPSAASPTAGASPVVAPPVPAPVTAVPFPLDPTRYYLLGQLEYYLSPQNMAKDFFLRKKMDLRGWIPISLISSFNRVKILTQDVNLVKEVLYLSSMVQVRDEWVRMGGWETFVLPDAGESVVPEFDIGVNLNHPMYPMLNGVPVGPPQPGLFGFGAPLPESRPKDAGGVRSGEDSAGGEDDEEDVVFVYETEAA